MNGQERRKLAAVARRLVGQKVERIEFPGGKSRKSVRLVFAGGKTAIATQRRTSARAEMEARVMRVLREGGARVPRILAFDGSLLIQQDIGTARLSELLNNDDPRTEQVARLNLALASMAEVHEAAAKAGLAAEVPPIGVDDDWIGGLVARPRELGAALGIAAPEFDVEAAQRMLAVRRPAFVKWDSRPGNALIGRNGAAYWFDWEHCGARNALDDMVWLLADEFTPSDPETSDQMLDRYLPAFADAFGMDEAQAYFRTMATFHSCVRLELILRKRSEGSWWRMKDCLKGDRIGVTRRCARRLLRRAGRWSGEIETLAPLANWFAEVREMVDALD